MPALCCGAGVVGGDQEVPHAAVVRTHLPDRIRFGVLVHSENMQQEKKPNRCERCGWEAIVDQLDFLASAGHATAPAL